MRGRVETCLYTVSRTSRTFQASATGKSEAKTDEASVTGAQGWMSRGGRWGFRRPAGAKSCEALIGLSEVLEF